MARFCLKALFLGFFLLVPPGAEAAQPLIGALEARQLKDSALFVDVRSEAEYDRGHIDGALLIPLDQLPDRVGEVPKDKDVVVYCRSGRRSALARAFLESLGYTRVRSMIGGLRDWESTEPITVGAHTPRSGIK